MFINLHDQKIYCLPDNYEVVDNSLNDIKYNLNPIFSKKDIEHLNTNVNHARALDGTDFIPGTLNKLIINRFHRSKQY